MRAVSFLSLSCWTSFVCASVLRLPEPVSLPTARRLYQRDDCGPPPPELQMNRAGQFPDGSYGCGISENDPDPYGAQKQCQAQCPKDTTSSQEGTGPAIICPGASWPQDHPCAGQLVKSNGLTLGRCICGSPVIEYIVKEVTVFLPTITAVGCIAFFKVLETVVEWAAKLTRADILFEAVAIVVEAFASISIAAPTDLDVIPMLFEWITQNACDTSAVGYDVLDQIDKFFDTVVNFGSGRGFKTGPRRPERIDPSASARAPEPTAAPKPSLQTPSPTNNGPSQTQDSSYTTTATTSEAAPACGLVKRARRTGKDSWTSCDINGNIHSTVVTTMKFGAQESTFTKTCSSSWKHACAHYSSMVVNNPTKGWDALKCDDSLGVPRVIGRERPIVKEWNDQHHRDWTDPKYRIQLTCDRDEFPPAYFFPPNHPVMVNKEQFVRLIPDSDNRGVASLWNNFCWKSGLAAADNEMSLEQKNQADSLKVNKGSNGRLTTTYTTSVSMSVNYKPVFSIASYDLGGLNAQNFGLIENPCIPIGIQDDFLFPLLKNDPAVNNGANWLQDYSKPPSPQVLAAARDVRG